MRPATLGVLVIAFLLVACGGGGSDAGRITLEGEALRNFLRPMLLTADDLPVAPASEAGEGFVDDPEEGEEVGSFGLAGADWRGWLSHGYFIPGPDGSTFALANGVFAFDSAADASSWFEDVEGVYAEELGKEVADQTPGANVELEELNVGAGDESWSVAFTSTLSLPDAPGDVLSAFVFFRRGPIIGLVGTSGFIPLDEPFLAAMSARMDERIQERLGEE